jgi:hypothetical protein
MKITMDKKWAQRKDPTKEVRVLCVDGGNKDFPVIYLDKFGDANSATINGYFYYEEGEDGEDLVPLQEKVADVWVVVRRDRTTHHGAFFTEADADRWIDEHGLTCHKPYRVVRMTQAEEKS